MVCASSFGGHCNLGKWLTSISVCAAAIYRTYILPSLINSVDYTWDNPPQNIWGSIEANAGIFCASVPALKPFFTKYLPAIISSSFRSHDRSTGSGFEAFATKVERNRKRRQDKSHELSSRDKNAPENSFPADHDLDDETRLWSHTGQTVPAVLQSSSAESISKNQQTHRRQDGLQVNMSARDHPNRSNSERAEIHISRETKITYGNV